jgi:hypothetical protein
MIKVSEKEMYDSILEAIDGYHVDILKLLVKKFNKKEFAVNLINRKIDGYDKYLKKTKAIYTETIYLLKQNITELNRLKEEVLK